MVFTIGSFAKLIFENAGQNLDGEVLDTVVIDDEIGVIGTRSNDFFVHRGDGFDVLVDDVFIASSSFLMVADKTAEETDFRSGGDEDFQVTVFS